MKPAVLLLLCLAWLRPSQAQAPLENLMRLKAGNYWVYQGTIESLAEPGGQSTRTVTRQVNWKIEITEQSTHGPLKAYLVHGSFDDLPWSDTVRQPGYYLWIVYQGRFYSLPASAPLMRSFHDPKDPMTALVVAEEPMLELPLTSGKCHLPLEPKEPRNRDDLFYCWHFEGRRRDALHVEGVALDRAEAWELWYRSNPDHQIWGLAPGIGFVFYTYGHHGTPFNVDMKLVKAHLN